jgi:asparagine synthase (glutamine-hydrolysing)
MCGIVGWYGPKPDKAIVKKMNDRISHRGPDSSGIFADDNVCLAMRRLAIIDLSPKGNQPMTSTTGKTTIVFNGEIYNFAELRPRIRNYKFRSGSDTEIILALYEQEGEACVKLLRGMFAFAIYDHDKKTLFIARDRLGKKPLYYYHDGKALLFASELKALLVHPLLASRTVNQIAVSQYLRFGYVPDPLSIFTQVCKLPPAHTLTATKEGITVKEYWDLDFNSKTTMTMQQAEERIRQLVDESVKLRMIADVPIGAFLSGGSNQSKHSP